MKIRLPISLTPLQKKVDDSPARFKILKWGRRTGKTWFIGYWLVKQALTRPGKHWYVTKTLALGREELWPVLMTLLPRDLVSRTDERLLNVRLTNGSSIWIKSGEKEDNLRGRGLASVVLDEAAFLKERVWDQILRPQLAHSKGPAIIASSPKKGWFTRLFNEAAKGDANWLPSHATIYDNPTVDRDEIEVIKAKTPDSTWRQEYMAEELANVGQVYDEFSRANVYNPKELFTDVLTYPCILGLDWGKEADAGAAWVHVSPEGWLILSKTHRKNGWDVDRHAQVINPISAARTIRANVLDRSAFRDVGTGVSIAQLFDRAGIHCQQSERDVQSSIAYLKRFLRGGEQPWFYVSSECPDAIEAFTDWEHGQHEPDIAAAIRYAAVWAITRRLTHLANIVPPRRPGDPLSGLDDNTLLALAKAPKVSIPSTRWTWDGEAGRPY